MATIDNDALKEAQGLLDFINASPSPFHVVQESTKRLEAAGFKKLLERERWNLEKNGRYYFTRNRSTIVAFAVGGEYQEGNGIVMLGAHTDSPCLKVKPNSVRSSQKLEQVGVQLYGGGLWHTWFDRDLTVAGRVMVKKSDGSFEMKLVHIPEPILRIPNLAIHLNRGVNSEGFKFNEENHLQPVLCSLLNAKADASEPNRCGRHNPELLNKLKKHLDCNVEDIHDFELCLADTQPACLGGLKNEFLFSPRLDNLFSAYCSIEALTRSLSTLAKDKNIRLITLFDHEEIGSSSAYGADSLLLESCLRRIVSSFSQAPSIFEETIQKSFMVSADQAHAAHPNYAEKHDGEHRPSLNDGVVIKYNANQRYATTAVTALVFKEIARLSNQPIQEIVMRNDVPCGSTIGPIISSGLGLRTIDVGAPQLSMHSIREMGGSKDVISSIHLFEGYFNHFASVDARVTIAE